MNCRKLVEKMFKYCIWKLETQCIIRRGADCYRTDQEGNYIEPWSLQVIPYIHSEVQHTFHVVSLVSITLPCLKSDIWSLKYCFVAPITSKSFENLLPIKHLFSDENPIYTLRLQILQNIHLLVSRRICPAKMEHLSAASLAVFFFFFHPLIGTANWRSVLY